MTRAASESLVRSFESIFEGGSVAGLSDRQLLERFTRARDAVGEAAFAALVARHGPMVLNLCAQVLGDLHHAEDAFQAVFLVLARKARSIRDPDFLSSWLYAVALRTARCAKLQLDRRRKKEEGDAMRGVGPGSAVLLEPIVQPAEQPAVDREQAEALYSEIGRLPNAFRLPVMLCYFEGLTLDEAARRLGCPTGTLRSRLARARDKLRRGLTRRGLVLSGGTLAAVLAPRSTSASVSSLLCETTTRAAISFAAGQSAATLATALAQEVLRSMLVNKLRLTALALLVLGAVATSAGYLTYALATNQEPKNPAPGRQTPVLAHPGDANQKPAAGRMFVVGRVLDPQGKPVPGATVAASVRSKFSGSSVGFHGLHMTPIGFVNADQSGRFRLDAPRTSSSRNDEFMAIALAPGYGLGWLPIDPDADQPAADITLQPEQVIEGRLFDVQGRPVQNVVVSVSSIQRDVVHASGPQILGRVSSEGPQYWWAQVNDVPAWPKPATTDANGRFTIHGVGRRLKTKLAVIDPRFALDMIDVDTDDKQGAISMSVALQPAKIFTGRVTYADTGKPVGHARLSVSASGAGRWGFRPTYFQTDADGRFRVNPSPGERFTISAGPPAGQTYLRAQKRIDWPKGAVEQSIDLALPRGVPIRGAVVEEGAGQPVAGARVNFRSHLRADSDAGADFSESVTAADGSFELAVSPSAGHLAVHAPNDDYVLRVIGNREFFNGQPGGSRLYSHCFVACDPKPSGPGLEVRVALRRGVTVTGRVVGPDDKPVQDAWIISGVTVQPTSTAWRLWYGYYHGQALGARFELHGVDPDADLAVHFFEPKRRLGARVQLPGKPAAGGPMTVRLEPCGTTTARLVDANKRPLAGYRGMSLIRMIVTPGPEYQSRDPGDMKRLSDESDYLVRIDPINYPEAPRADAQGRITFPALIAGAQYRIIGRRSSGTRPREDFTVKPGKTLDLGDILIEKPRTQ